MTTFHGVFRRISENESKQLDSLRGASAFAVAVGHANQIIVAPISAIASGFLGLLAQASVMVFFVLSGFLIGKSIARNIERTGDDSFAWKQYAIDRAYRLYPPLVFSIVVMYLLYRLAPYCFPSGTTDFFAVTSSYARTGLHIHWKDILGALVFQNDFRTATPDMNGPLWSLSIEAWYYALAGIVTLFARKPMFLVIGLVAICLGTHWNSTFFIYLPVWLSGYVVSVLHNRGVGIKCSQAYLGIAVFGIVSLVFAALYLADSTWISSDRVIQGFNVAFGLAFAFVMFSTLSGYVHVPVTMAPVASYTYTLYLIHVPILLFVFGVAEQGIEGNLLWAAIVAIATVFICVLIARVASRMVENGKFFKRSSRIALQNSTERV